MYLQDTKVSSRYKSIYKKYFKNLWFCCLYLILNPFLLKQLKKYRNSNYYTKRYKRIKANVAIELSHTFYNYCNRDR